MKTAADEGPDSSHRRYLRWLQEASPESIERVHARILVRLSADQRLALMRAAATAAHLPQRALDEPGMATPARVARCLGQAQSRLPGVLAPLLGLVPAAAALRRLAVPLLAGALAGAFSAGVLAGVLDDRPAGTGDAEDSDGEVDMTDPEQVARTAPAPSAGDPIEVVIEDPSPDMQTAFDPDEDLLSMVGDLFA